MKLTRNMIALVGVLFVSQPVSSDEFKSLFNGKDLSGWTRIGLKKDVWSVENGQIIMAGEGGGWLGSNEEYSDFEFQTEFQLSSDSNSGIYLRAPADTSHNSRTGMEIQLLDTETLYKLLKEGAFTLEASIVITEDLLNRAAD